MSHKENFFDPSSAIGIGPQIFCEIGITQLIFCEIGISPLMFFSQGFLQVLKLRTGILSEQIWPSFTAFLT